MAAKENQKRWTEKEIGILKDNCNEDYNVLESLFPDRSLKSVKHKISGLKLPRVKQYYIFTKEEDCILRENSMENQEVILSLLPNRTWESIVQRILKLGLDRQKAWNYWSEEEELVLLSFETIEEMTCHLPNRTESQIYSKAVKMGKRFDNFWSEDELEVLHDNYGKRQVKDFADLLPNRDIQGIYGKSHSLGLVGLMGKAHIVSDEDIIALYQQGHYRSQIAKMTNLTLSTVTNRLEKNGIHLENKVLYGDESPAWKGGVTSENTRVRGQKEYRQWRSLVFERDNYTCQCCGDSKGGNLHSHHIYNFAEYISIRFEVSNGITICDKCHSFQIAGSFHHTYGTRDNNIFQLQEYFDDIRPHLGLSLVTIESIISP